MTMCGQRSGKPFRPGLVDTGAEIAVRFLAGEHGIDPAPGVGDDLFVIQDIAQVSIALEPVRQFFPAELAGPICGSPGAFVEIEPFRDFLEMSSHPIGFQFELTPQPAGGRDAANGQFDERARGQWGAIAT